MPRRSAIVRAFLLGAAAAVSVRADDFDAWVLSRGQVQRLGHPTEASLPVGSLQKPFLVRAWALSHPAAAPPTFACTRASGCWRGSGHGSLDLRGAIRESCNTFFKLLARDIPQEAIRTSFRDAGFVWSGEMTAAEAIGLPGPAEVRVAPEQLLASYIDLAGTPWPDRDDVRKELRSGLRDSAQDGTASGLGLWGFMAKTGTVPALDGAPLKTSGFALVLDDAGFAFLGLLRRGTGREAAIRAGALIAKLRPGLVMRPAPLNPSTGSRPRPSVTRAKRGVDDAVRVQMLDELRLSQVRLKNLSRGPIDSSRGFVGPGAVVTVATGDRFSEARWEIQASKPALQRRVHAAIEVVKGEGPIRLIATMTVRDYANGILKAELGPSPSLRTPLAAAVLRFISRGPRHPQANVCDSTHCAWFVGDGPVPRWLRPLSAVNEKETAKGLTDSEWTQAIAGARKRPTGPDLWTADCGGDPVSSHFIWGGGDRRVVSCPRHPKGRGRIWRREWSATNLASVFGTTPEVMDVTTVAGQWMLRVTIASPTSPSGPSNTIALGYDEAHRRLAQPMGWDALPAPASRVSRTAGGFTAEGVGFGHRAGLCLRP